MAIFPQVEGAYIDTNITVCYNKIMKVKFIDQQDKVNTFCEYVKLGCSIKGACGGMGISETAYYSWINKAEKDIEAGIESSEVEFYKSIKKAEKDFETRNLQIIQSHAIDDWKAAAWLLERRRQKEYVVKQDWSMSVPDKITINMDVKADE